MSEYNPWQVGLINWANCTCYDGDDPNCPEHKEES